MLSRLREQLGTAGLVVAIVALVAALAGGAIAANGGAGDGNATASAKAKKGPRGPKGPKGDTGPAGPAGAQGPKGDKGDAGANGSNGADGTKGATGSQGNQGVKGATGPTGPTGQTGYTETLPVGETETGTWSVSQNSVPSFNLIPVAISFPIPLPASVDPVYLNAAETAAEAETGGCKWEQNNPEAKPEAPEGTLCVFEQIAELTNSPGFLFFNTPGEPAVSVAGPAGIYAWFGTEGEPSAPSTLSLAGAWAVTAGPPGP